MTFTTAWLLLMIPSMAAPTAKVDKPAIAPSAVSSSVDLLAGAKWQYSTDGGKTYAPAFPVVKAETKASILARATFEVELAPGVLALELRNVQTAGRTPLYTINGSPVVVPLSGMRYHDIGSIDPKVLRPGENTLTARLAVNNKTNQWRRGRDSTIELTPKLVCLSADDLEFTIGPVLGAVGEDFFTVTCRTNMPAQVTLTVIGGTKARPTERRITEIRAIKGQAAGRLQGVVGGLFHRFRAKLTGVGPFEYRLSAALGGRVRCVASGRVKAIAPGGSLRFIAMGDSRTHPEAWAKLAAAALKAKPDLAVFSGDLVSDGRDDWQWSEDLFTPASKFFANVPFYPIMGNHESGSPLFDQIFYAPTKDGYGHRWSQTIGSVLLIGIDGREVFAPGSPNGRWLAGVLAGSQAKFIFLVVHYPGWSSGSHGRCRPDGTPVEAAVRRSRFVIEPLLEKYRATAIICGHDHYYERTELPGGLTQIITGGAGAPLREKLGTAARQNPYSKVFVSKLHYCLFEVDGDTCVMKAVTPEGEVIDTRRWKARR